MIDNFRKAFQTDTTLTNITIEESDSNDDVG
jgi:hypothetical protein